MQIIVGRIPELIKNPNFKLSKVPGAFKKVGKTHCKITYEDGAYWIENIRAINGTYIDGIPLTGRKQVFPNNDIILGGSNLKIDGVYPINVHSIVSSFSRKGGGGPEPDVSYASWGSRLGGILLDWLFITLILIPIGFILQLLLFYAGYDLTSGSYGENIDKGVLLFAGLFYIGSIFLVHHFYYAVELNSKGRTLGKRLVGVKVLDATSHELPSKTQAWGRLLGYFLSSLILYVGFLMPLWTKKKQAFHDLMANTIVVKDNKQ